MPFAAPKDLGLYEGKPGLSTKVLGGTVAESVFPRNTGSDRVSFAISGTSHNDPVAIAPGTDLNLKLGHYPAGGDLAAGTRLRYFIGLRSNAIVS